MKLVCPDCGKSELETIRQKHNFTYGVGTTAEKITAVLPFRHCPGCGLRFLDHEGEEAMHEAFCRHLGVMTPSEIKKLRQSYGLSRKEFAQLTRFGEAPIARWERGALIQNAANDQLLRLLSFPENLARLRHSDRS